jgi:hypothetical protein
MLINALKMAKNNLVAFMLLVLNYPEISMYDFYFFFATGLINNFIRLLTRLFGADLKDPLLFAFLCPAILFSSGKGRFLNGPCSSLNLHTIDNQRVIEVFFVLINYFLKSFQAGSVLTRLNQTLLFLLNKKTSAMICNII